MVDSFVLVMAAEPFVHICSPNDVVAPYLKPLPSPMHARTHPPVLSPALVTALTAFLPHCLFPFAPLALIARAPAPH